MVGKQLGFVLSHNGNPQGSKRIFPSIHRTSNITLRKGWSGRGYTGRKFIEIPILPTTNTLEEGKAKEEQER
jgi:hypothetical protein